MQKRDLKRVTERGIGGERAERIAVEREATRREIAGEGTGERVTQRGEGIKRVQGKGESGEKCNQKGDGVG